jgi:soluble lytic murein transglycosylase-like protein
VTNPLDPAQSIDGGARYLKQQLDAFGGDPSLALAAYNAGPGAVRACGCIPPYPETQAYVARILGLLRGAGDSAGLATGLDVRLVK